MAVPIVRRGLRGLSIQFWPDPARDLEEVARVLRRRGQFVAAVSVYRAKGGVGLSEADLDHLGRVIDATGFKDAAVAGRSRSVAYVVATRGKSFDRIDVRNQRG